jgi:hypothetical protein
MVAYRGEFAPFYSDSLDDWCFSQFRSYAWRASCPPIGR